MVWKDEEITTERQVIKYPLIRNNCCANQPTWGLMRGLAYVHSLRDLHAPVAQPACLVEPLIARQGLAPFAHLCLFALAQLAQVSILLERLRYFFDEHLLTLLPGRRVRPQFAPDGRQVLSHAVIDLIAELLRGNLENTHHCFLVEVENEAADNHDGIADGGRAGTTYFTALDLDIVHRAMYSGNTHRA